MADTINHIFEDEMIQSKIRDRLPLLFQLAENECSRAGKIGMEVGSLREKIIIALLIYKFGQDVVETNIPITEAEIDVKVMGTPFSIKTITGKKLGGVKLIWTVDYQKAEEFFNHYMPACDLLLIHINWGGIRGFYHIPVSVQKYVMNVMGKNDYIKLPKRGTNPRGVEVSKNALEAMAKHKKTKLIKISWNKKEIHYNPYKKWVDFWREDIVETNL